MVNSISFPTPQAYSGGADFSLLANLGNVYKKAQEDARSQEALGRLGQGQDADAQTLLTSQVPGLAQLGLNMQASALNRQREDARYAVTDARENARLAIQKAAATRAQKDWEQKDIDEAEAAKLISGFGVPATAATPFPAPLPGAQPVQQQPLAAPVADTAPSAFGANPPMPSALQAVPVKAEGEDPSTLPAWADPTTARIASNLTSGQPAATAGISRDQLAQLYRNPMTRPLATAFLQKQFDPGSWTYHFNADTGRVIATNSNDPSRTKDVTPGGPAGAAGSKIEREQAAYARIADERGYTGRTRELFIANGKLPTADEAIKPGDRRQVDKALDIVDSSAGVINSLDHMKKLSSEAFSGPTAGARGYAASFLPSGLGGDAGTATQLLHNEALREALGQLKSIFTGNQSNAEHKLLLEMEGSVNQVRYGAPRHL